MTLTNDQRATPRRLLLAIGLLFAQGFACSGGNDFTAADGSVANDAGDSSSIVANPNGDSTDAGSAPVGTADATTGLPSVDASGADATAALDAGAVDSGPTDGQGPDAVGDGAARDAFACPAMTLACDGGCIPNDIHNCGACGTACASPEGGTATCAVSASPPACVASCPTNLTKCGAACVPLQTDQNNCGTCGHSCVHGACQAGSCQPWVIAIENTVAENGTQNLATDGTNVVWSSGTGINEAPVQGGNPIPLLAQSTLPIYGVAMASKRVVWTLVDSNAGVYLQTATEDVAGSASTNTHLVTGGSMCSPMGLTVTPDGTTAYLIVQCSSGSQVYQCDLNSFNCSSLATVGITTSYPSNDVAFANGFLFWTDYVNGSVQRYSTTSPTKQIDTLAVTQNPFRLAVDATYVYWAEDESTTTSEVARALQSTLSGGNVVVGAVAGRLISGMASASDGTGLYFSADDYFDGGVPGDHLKVAPVNGASAPVALPNLSPETLFGMAAAGGVVYWFAVDATSTHLSIYGVRGL